MGLPSATRYRAGESLLTYHMRCAEGAGPAPSISAASTTAFSRAKASASFRPRPFAARL